MERLVEKFRTLISNNDIKGSKSNPDAVKNLPDEIKAPLLGDFKDLIEDNSKIAKIDPLNIPPGMSLKVSADFDEIPNNKGDVNLDVDIGNNNNRK